MKKRKRKAPSIGKVAKKTVSNLSKKAFDRMYPRSKSDKQKTNAAGEKSGGGFYGEGLNAPVGYAEGFGDVQLPKPKQPRIKGKKRGKYKARGGSILRAGKTALKGGNRALARFIAARYSPKAIAKYQDYAGRLRRSKRLIKQIVKIDDATYRIKGYIIKTDTAGNNPYSCTCPDFSQFSIDARNWLGSKAGPFNPCKHMMAVRDRGASTGRWFCANNACTRDPLATEADGGYATKAQCDADRRIFSDIPFVGGQCNAPYLMVYEYSISPKAGGPTLTGSGSIPCDGPIGGMRAFLDPTLDVWKIQARYTVYTTPPTPAYATTAIEDRAGAYNADFTMSMVSLLVIPLGNDDCGNAGKECSIETGIRGCMRTDAINYNPAAQVDNGSCIFPILGCTNASASNYNPDANTDDGSCTYDVYGCTDSDATNYNPDATIDDGSCTY